MKPTNFIKAIFAFTVLMLSFVAFTSVESSNNDTEQIAVDHKKIKRPGHGTTGTGTTGAGIV